jgi:hypothetical protein
MKDNILLIQGAREKPTKLLQIFGGTEGTRWDHGGATLILGGFKKCKTLV